MSFWIGLAWSMIAWTVWTVEDIRTMQIHLVWFFSFLPLLYFFNFSWFNLLFLPVYLALLAWNQYQNGFKRGDDYMLVAYGLSTLYAPLTGLIALALVAGSYIYIVKLKCEKENIDLSKENKDEGPIIYFAPAFQISCIATLILFSLQVAL